MFLWAGPHQACLRNHSGAVRDLKFGRNERFYEHFGVIMFFGKDPPQTEGRRHADHKIKTPPEWQNLLFYFKTSCDRGRITATVVRTVLRGSARQKPRVVERGSTTTSHGIDVVSP